MLRAVSALVALNALAVGNAVTPQFTTYFGGSRNDFAQQIAVDASGNVYVAGSTNSGDLPGPPAPFSITAPQQKTCFLSPARSYDCTPPEGFVAKIAADGSKVLYSAYFGDRIVGIAVDNAGDLYVAGVGHGQFTGFVLKIDPAGNQIYEAGFEYNPTAIAVDSAGNIYVGTDANNVEAFRDFAAQAIVYAGTGPVSAITAGASGKVAVTGGSYVPVVAIIDVRGAVSTRNLLPTTMPNATASAVAIDAADNVYAAGTVNGAAFVAAFDTNSRYLIFLDGSGADSANGIAGDGASRAYVVGRTTSPNFPVTGGVPPNVAPDGTCIGVSAYGSPTFSRCGDGFLTQLDPTGKSTYSTYLGGNAEDTITAVAVDPTGYVYVAGWTRSDTFPTTAGAMQESRAAGTCPIVYSLLTAPGNTTLYSPCADAFIAKLSIPIPNATPLLISSASYANLPIAPGALVSLFGHGLGPQTGVVATPSATSGFGTNLAGVQVLFDGVPAPLLYAQDGQINATVPFGITTQGRTHVQVVYNNQTIDAGNHAVGTVSPGVFTLDASGSGQAAIVNQDNSINGPSHPAAKGSIISIYATGAGQTDPASTDGGVAGNSPPAPLKSVSGWFQSSNVLNPFVAGQVTYYGGAPTLVNGVLQVNVRIPDGALSGVAVPFFVQIGDQASQVGATVVIQ